MGGGRRKWITGSAGWRLHWVDGGTAGVFKVEQEGDGITDATMEEWGDWMDQQFERRFEGTEWPPLTASTLNFSRNELGDEGVRSVVEYLRRREISVQMVKFFKNSIGDAGAWAIGQLLAHCREPVHEVHLSHNHITEQGACSLLEAVARSKRYPFPSDRSGRRDPKGLTPVWLRLEYNCIQWCAIEHRLDSKQVRWCAAESRDGWAPKDYSPMVCMHSSYKNQKPEIPAAHPSPPPRKGGGKCEWAVKEAPGSGGEQELEEEGEKAGPRDENGAEEVPLYVFLDTSAVLQFAAIRPSPRPGLFTFQGLLNLCQQGHMKCVPPDDKQTPSWLGAVEERDRIIFVVTDSVTDELLHFAEHNANASERGQIEWLCNAPDSYLHVCHQWGILEVLGTELHRQLLKLGGWEQRARDLKISKWALKNFDFACLWESQIESEGRVLFVSADEALCAFAAECAASTDGVRCVAVVHASELDRSFANDREHGGHRLHEAAQKPRAGKFCGTVLSAQIMYALVVATALGGSSSAAEVEALRQELREALAICGDARHLLGSLGAAKQEAGKCLERMDEAKRRWEALLSRRA